MPWTLCTKADVISIHPTNETALPDFWSEAVEGMIRQHLSNPFLGISNVITGELQDGNGGSIILVDCPPVLSVQRLSINGAVIPPSEYRVLKSGVELYQSSTYAVDFPSGAVSQGHLNVSIDYTSGSVEIDPVVRLCAAAMVVAMLNYRGRSGSDASMKWGDATVKEGEPSVSQSVGLTDHLYKIMRRLLRRNKLRIA